MTSISKAAQEAAYIIKFHLHGDLPKAKTAIICGSGLSGITDLLEAEPKIEISYDKIPGFKTSTVAGHQGKLVIGFMGDVPVICMSGRLQ